MVVSSTARTPFPPCTRVAVYEGRGASLIDTEVCGCYHGMDPRNRFFLKWGPVSEVVDNYYHPDYKGLSMPFDLRRDFRTNDEQAIERAWEAVNNFVLLGDEHKNYRLNGGWS